MFTFNFQVFDLLLSPHRDDPDFMREAKRLWFSERDPIKIVKNFRLEVENNKKSREIWLFQGLAEHYNGGKGDMIKAYKTIPQYMRSLYYPSFKSFLWNHLVSFRIRTFGLKPIPGDIVNLQTREAKNAFPLDFESNDGERGRENCDLLSHEVKVLTENDFDSNGDCHDYSIYDVVLDSPGTRMVKYANSKIQSYFEILLKVNQLQVDCFAKFRE